MPGVEKTVHKLVVLFEFPGLENTANFLKERIAAACFESFERGHVLSFNVALREAHQVLEFPDFATVGKGDRFSRAACAPGATDAVHVVLAVLRQVVVEDDFEVIDIEPAGGDIGGYEEFDFSFFQPAHDAFAGGLGDVAVELVGGESAGEEMFGEFIDHHFRRTENDAVFEVEEVDDAAEDFEFRAALDFVIELLDVRRGDRLALNAHACGVLGKPFDHPLDGRRHGG